MADNTIGIASDNGIVVQAGAPADLTTRVINAALAKGGAHSIRTPGRYTVNGSQSPFAAIFIPSDTSLYLGPGVELFLEANSNVALMANENAFETGILLSPGDMIASGNTIAINLAGIGTRYPAGSWVSVDFVATKGYQGVYQVDTSPTPNQITLINQWGNLLTTSPAVAMAVSAPFDVTGVLAPLQIAIRPANKNIHIWGEGILNGNGLNQTSSPAGDPRGLGCYLRGVANSHVDLLKTRRARCWTIALNNTLNVRVSRINPDNAIGGTGGGANATDCVHQTGENRNCVVEDIFADSITDNVVGSTLDYIDPGTGALPFAWQTPGDNHNSTVRRIGARRTTSPIVTKWGNINFSFIGTHIVDTITGNANAPAFQMVNYAPTSMLNCNGGVLKLSNVSANCNTSPVSISANGTWDCIEIDNVRTLVAATVSSAAVLIGLSSGGTPSVVGIKQLKIGKLFYTTTFDGTNRANAIFSVGGTLAGTINIGYLDISDIEEIPMAAGAAMIHIANNTTTLANIKRIALSNVSTTGLSGAGALLRVSLASTVGEITMYAARYTGTGGTGHLLNLGAAVVAGTQISFGAGCSAPNAAGFLSSAAASIGRLNGPNCAFDPGPAGALITAPSPGDMFYNTNATFTGGVGVVVRGAAAFTRIL